MYFLLAWVDKRVGDVPPERKLQRGYIQMFPQNEKQERGYVRMFPRYRKPERGHISQGRANHEVQTVNWNTGIFEAEMPNSRFALHGLAPP